MDVTPDKRKTLATKLKENMGKLVITVLVLSAIVILVTYAVTVEGRSENDSNNSTENEISNSNSNSNSVYTDNVSTHAPTETTTTRSEAIQPDSRPPGQLLNASVWSAATLKTGNGSVFVDKVQIKLPMEDDGYEKTLLDQMEKTSKYWFDQAQMTLKDRLYKQQNTNVAKNIIYFLGDGMSLTTLTAARIFQGQLNGKNGEETDLWFQKFPNVGLAKTYCLDLQVSDSACTATAYLSGVKANKFTEGVNGQVEMNDCEASNNPKNHVYSLLRWAQLAGKSTGFVTNTRVTHATPAAVYSHSSNRLHESDHDVISLGLDPNKCIDIGRQLIESETAIDLNVIMGGGATKLLPNNTFDSQGKRGQRHDGRHLINEWISNQKKASSKWAHVTNRDSLLNVDHTKVDKLLGIFASEHMSFHSDANHSVEPSLTEMTEMAMNILSKNDNGYVLFVEGGLIDYANHATLAHKAVVETCEFNEAIKMADLKTSELDTMIVVTSDHSHTMTISGYPSRGTNILGTMTSINEGVKPSVADHYDNKSVTIISYAYGPGYFYNHDDNGKRIDLDSVTIDKNFQYITSVGSNDEAHGGDDVGIFSRGPFSHLLSGVVEQNYIPHVCAYAACLGAKGTANRCEERYDRR